MTGQKSQEDYDQGYWVEFAKERLAGGVSVGSRHVEGGLGAIYSEGQFGVTGYLQYSLAFLSARGQIDLLSDQRWIPQVVFGVPLEWEQFRLEPHILWALEKDKPVQPRLGLRMQYVF
ncbi:MAG TPA: hypothetical protein DDZ66_04130 [Firmicutes bacterium]|nr:hypothetical protein [Bacillota bacterium]